MNSGVSLWMDQMSELIFGAFPVPPQINTNDERPLSPDEQDEARWSDVQDGTDPHDLDSGAEHEGLATPSSIHEPSFKDNGDSR
ncbi:hypothetical protein C0989_006688 [Termitomyces sp. Mn162]|nr:hypothetical protein C0989_006688 [Termitomyces sp. Mn162]